MADFIKKSAIVVPFDMIAISNQAYQIKKATFPKKVAFLKFGVPESIRTTGPFLRWDVKTNYL